LSEQLRTYYRSHLDPGDSPDVSDLEALRAIEAAQSAFDTRLTTSFAPALREVAGLGYPNNSDPSIKVATRLAPTDGLDHEAAVLFVLDSVAGAPGEPRLTLPETSNGLGYQNLISMILCPSCGFARRLLRKGEERSDTALCDARCLDTSGAGRASSYPRFDPEFFLVGRNGGDAFSAGA